MSNEMVKAKEKELTWNKNQLDLIKRTVAKGATDDEFGMFMYLAKTYQLDPISKEIWFIKYSDKAVPIIMTSRDGYLTIANRNKRYEGMLSDVVHENDEFEKMPDGTVKHKYGCKNRGKIIGAYAIGYRDDRKYPVYIFAQFDEYFKKSSNIWVQYGSAMILKVAEAMMLKRLFSISGLVTKEEIAIEDKNDVIKAEGIEPGIRATIEKVFPKDKEVEEDVISDEEAKVIEAEVEHAEAIEAEQEQEDHPEGDFKPASDKQKDFIYGIGDKKGIVHSKYITDKEVKHIGKKEDLDIAKASKILAWWWGNKDKNVIGEREKRENNPKIGKNALEVRGILMEEVLGLMKKNYIKEAEKKKMYKKYQKNAIQNLATEELEELKVLLENYTPDWS